jgi:hypothetical protein
MSDESSSENQPNTAAQILLASVPDGRRNTNIPVCCVMIAMGVLLLVLPAIGFSTMAAVSPLIAEPSVCYYCKKSFELNNVTYSLQHSKESSGCEYINDNGETKKYKDHFKLSCIIGLSISLSIGVPLLLIIILIDLYLVASIWTIIMLQDSGNNMYNTYNTKDKVNPFQDIRKNACYLGFCWPYVLYKVCTTMPKTHSPPSRYV